MSSHQAWFEVEGVGVDRVLLASDRRPFWRWHIHLPEGSGFVAVILRICHVRTVDQDELRREDVGKNTHSRVMDASRRSTFGKGESIYIERYP